MNMLADYEVINFDWNTFAFFDQNVNQMSSATSGPVIWLSHSAITHYEIITPCDNKDLGQH